MIVVILELISFGGTIIEEFSHLRGGHLRYITIKDGVIYNFLNRDHPISIVPCMRGKKTVAFAPKTQSLKSKNSALSFHLLSFSSLFSQFPTISVQHNLQLFSNTINNTLKKSRCPSFSNYCENALPRTPPGRRTKEEVFSVPVENLRKRKPMWKLL